MRKTGGFAPLTTIIQINDGGHFKSLNPKDSFGKEDKVNETKLINLKPNTMATSMTKIPVPGANVPKPHVPPTLPVQVKFPDPKKPTGKDFHLANEKIVIDLMFTETMDRHSIIPGKTLIFHPETSLNLRWSAVGSMPDSKLTITTDKKWKEMTNSIPPLLFFSLTLIGTDKGNGVVKSLKGIKLDGDYDAKAGGNYIDHFKLP